MQHRPLFADVDALAGEHAIAPAFHIRRPGQVGEQTQGLGSDALLGKIGEKIAEAEG